MTDVVENTQHTTGAERIVDASIGNLSPDEVHLDGARYVIETNIRIFGRAIIALSRVSDQLHMEPTHDGLVLRAFNSSKSACATMAFYDSFFTEFDTSNIDPEQYNLCRISMKSALSIFKVVNTADKSVLGCTLQIDPNADNMVIQLVHVHHVTKSYLISLRECAVTYRSLFDDKNKLLNRVTIPARELFEVVNQMGTDSEELRLVTTEDRFSVQKFITVEQDRSKMRKTEANIGNSIFEEFIVMKPGEVTLSLKEFRSIVAFADACNMNISLHYDQPGRPVVVAVEKNIDYLAEFTLATAESDRVEVVLQTSAVTTPAQRPRGAAGSRNSRSSTVTPAAAQKLQESERHDSTRLTDSDLQHAPPEQLMSQLVVNDTAEAQQAALEKSILDSILSPLSPSNEANQRANAASPSFMNLGTPQPIIDFPPDENDPMLAGGADHYDVADVQSKGRYSTPQKEYIRHLFRLSQESLNMDDAYADQDPLVNETIWIEEESQF
ncbi:Rad9 family protein [Aphelenchoides avenae]|nr:Rad9 family protein [Aphelenchus avenae]